MGVTMDADKITCMVCNKQMKMLNNSHLKNHGMTFEEYKALYPDAKTYSDKSLERIKENAVKNNAPKKGQKRSEEDRIAMSTGQRKSFENGREAHNKGKPMSEEQKIVLRDLALERNKVWTETGTHPLLGRMTPDIVKEKISESVRRYAVNNHDLLVLRTQKAIQTKKERGYVHKKNISFPKNKTYRIISMPEYLIEDNLEIFIKQRFGVNFIRNKELFGYRPDFYLPDINLVIEFDGYRHYVNKLTIDRDNKKDAIYSEKNIRVIRIPYFVQLDERIVKFLFSDYINDLSKFNNFPHGFIDKKATLPTYYCAEGIERFKNDLEYFSVIKDEIIKTLIDR